MLHHSTVPTYPSSAGDRPQTSNPIDTHCQVAVLAVEKIKPSQEPENDEGGAALGWRVREGFWRCNTGARLKGGSCLGECLRSSRPQGRRSWCKTPELGMWKVYSINLKNEDAVGREREMGEMRSERWLGARWWEGLWILLKDCAEPVKGMCRTWSSSFVFLRVTDFCVGNTLWGWKVKMEIY